MASSVRLQYFKMSISFDVLELKGEVLADRLDIIFSGHVLRRMFERNIRADEIRWIVENGKVVEDYPDDLPFPSKLLEGNFSGRQLHVVVAVDGSRCIAVTTYAPDPELWDVDGRTRRKP